jgi:hypothetical protein
MIAEVHSSIRAMDASEWLPRVPEWPEARDSVRDRLPHVVDDRALHAAADRVISGYEAVIDPVTVRVSGIFDWEAEDLAWTRSAIALVDTRRS